MKGLKIAIEKSTVENTNFRKVVYTSSHSQLVLMCLQPKEEIGEEIEQAKVALSKESETLKAGALGTIVIDYQEDTFSLIGKDYNTASRRSKVQSINTINGDEDSVVSTSSSSVVFRLADVVEGMVSWGEHQKLYVHCKEVFS